MNMPEQELIPLSSKELWKSRLNELPHHFGHTWEHCQSMFLSTGYPTYLYAFRLNDVLVLCPVCERSFGGYIDIVTPYGFNGFISNSDCQAFSGHWSAFAKERGYVCGYIGLNPLVNADLGFSSLEMKHYNDIFTLDLTKPTQTLINAMDENRKRQLRQLDKIRGSLTTEKDLLIPFFIKNFETFMKEKSAAGAYHFSASSLQWMAEMDNVMMTGLVENEKVEAASIFGYTSYAADFLFNISSEKGREASFALIWMAIEKLTSMNIPVLNLGGGVTPADSLSMFKKRFGGEVRPLRSLQQVFNEGIFQQLCKDNGVNISGSAYFPPYRQVKI